MAFAQGRPERSLRDDAARARPRRAEYPSIESQQKAIRAATAALNKHAEGVVVMDLRQLSSVADFFVVATAASRPQMRAITEAIEDTFKRSGERVGHVEGVNNPRAAKAKLGDGLSWVLMDCGDVIVHLFDPPARTFYQLERLWGDAPRIPVESQKTR